MLNFFALGVINAATGLDVGLSYLICVIDAKIDLEFAVEISRVQPSIQMQVRNLQLRQGINSHRAVDAAKLCWV